MPSTLRNRFLFSHLYLDQLCQDASQEAETANLIADLRVWLPDWDGSSLFFLISTQVEPTLVGLGFHYQRSSDVSSLLQLYSTYRRETPIGLCYVAHLQGDHDGLDSTVKGRHYAAKIIQALREEELSWGLLTDGQHWRLYHADELAPYETYLEIDLEQVLRDEGNAEMEDAALLFHLLFCESAFAPDEEGKCGLDRHLSRSEEATAGIEEHVSKCIEDVLRRLSQGFIERDGRDTYAPKQRDEVFHNATVLLYRMLFILYAEARDLLPLGDPAYDPYSLDALVEQAIDYTKGSGMPDPDATGLWQNLGNLCSWINSGDDRRHIPCYNGDLFDDSDKRYIHEQTIADKYLAPALFSLGCIKTDTEAGYRRIDYRDLSVRHLGSIYEGLLEYKLFIAQEPRVPRSDGKGGFIFPRVSETTLKKGEEENVIKRGDVYFAHSAGERKALGAYYTPEYIVDYIVKQTVWRGLEDRREELEEKVPGWLEEVEAAPPSERTKLQQFVDEKLVEFVEEEVLTFRVCDPAMGSGHFLVNAAHMITDFVVETLNLTPWENPEVDSDPVTWRRKVAKHCLYGVDLNKLAVELAKLSLWLTTVARGKPLSFLDHHLRQGNSLIGARLKDLEAALSVKEKLAEKEPDEVVQLSMLKELGFQNEVGKAIDILADISDRLAGERGDVADQATDYERAREALAPYRQFTDLLTARHFGVEVDERELPKIARCIIGRTQKEPHRWSSIKAEIQILTNERRFFHWNLEFPEVFIGMAQSDWKQNPGFDTVLGNPPYVAFYSKYAEEIDSDLRAYLEREFGGTVTQALNTFLMFIVQGLRIIHANGSFAMIVPDTLGINERYEPTRRFIFENSRDFKITILQFPVFEDSTVRCIIPVVYKGRGTEFCKTVVFNSPEAISANDWTQRQNLSREYLEGRPRFSFPFKLSGIEIEQKIRTSGDALNKLCKIRDGINPGPRSFRDQIVFDVCASHKSTLHPLIIGSNVQRYAISESYLWVDYDPKLLTPELKRRGASFREEWIFTSTKLMSRQTSDRLIFALDANQYYALNSVHHTLKRSKVSESLSYLLAILNSRLMQWYYVVTYQETRDIFPQVHVSALEQLPIRRIDFTTPEEERRRLVEAGQALYREYLDTTDWERLLEFVDSRLLSTDEDANVLKSEQADVVHDLLAYLAERMIKMHKHRQELEKRIDLFRYVDIDQPFVRLNEALVLDESRRPSTGSGRSAAEVMDLEAVHHDIDGLRLMPNEDDTWTLELQAKFRDPEQEWREWIKEEDGRLIKRQWVPAYRLAMAPQKARFYRYALPRLGEFDNASSFPGGFTRSTLKKLHLTRVPIPPDVDLSKLARLDRELADTRRKIDLTDDLIDQIVYKLYGLTEAEIAIVEGQA